MLPGDAGALPNRDSRWRAAIAIDLTCEASVLPPEPAPAATRDRVEELQVQTRFLRLGRPVRLGDRLDGWRVCWVGGWKKGKVLFVVMVERVVRGGSSLGRANLTRLAFRGDAGRASEIADS